MLSPDARSSQAGAAPAGCAETSPAWYAVQVKPHREQRVVHYLRTREVQAFLPLIEAVRSPAGASPRPRLEPLFPGYLFVSMGPWDRNPGNWDTVRWSPGVRRILGTPEAPLPVPGEAVAAIQERVRGLGFIRPGARFAPGDRVRIRSGPFAHLEAVFDRPVTARGRVRVLLQLLGQRSGLEIEELELVPA